MPLNKKNVWLDAEWYMNQHIFLLGYAVGKHPAIKHGQLWGKRLTKHRFQKLLKQSTGYVFGYGPDIGMCEKFFRWKFRNKFHCVNLIKCFRDHLKIGSFKLADLEIKYNLKRKVRKYKISILHIWRDWKDRRKRLAVLAYNLDDVVNLVKLTRIIFKKHNVTHDYLQSIRLA